jgi:REP element-mobilizing transposase RayT
MARKSRAQYPGAAYHVMNRGDRREPILRDAADRRTFLDTLGQACAKTGWQVHAWCLMPNHFHLVVETPRANLVAGMKWLLGTYGGDERRETDEARAERLSAEELRRRKWGPETLARRRKGDLEKVKVARRLRRATPMTLHWIAQRLRMGATGYAA